MNKQSILLLFIFLIGNYIYSQELLDVIVKKNKERIKCRITLINNNSIIYDRMDNQMIKSHSIGLNDVEYYELDASSSPQDQRLNLIGENMHIVMDEITQKFSFNYSSNTADTNLLLTIKKWISNTFEIDINSVKDENKQIRFIKLFPIYNDNYEKIIGSYNSIFSITVINNSYSLIASDFRYIDSKGKDTIRIEELFSNKLTDKSYNNFEKLEEQIVDIAISLENFIKQGRLTNNKMTAKYQNKSISKYDASAGDELIKSTNHFYAGISLTFIGAIVSVIGTAITDLEFPIFAVAGGATSLFGMVLSIESYSHIKKAGIILNLKLNNQSCFDSRYSSKSISLVYNF